MPALEILQSSQRGCLYILKMEDVSVTPVSKADRHSCGPINPHIEVLMAVDSKKSSVFQSLSPQINLVFPRDAHLCPRPSLGYEATGSDKAKLWLLV